MLLKMLHEIPLKNADDFLIIDNTTYEYFTTDPFLVEVGFINKIRKHSSGCAVFQMNRSNKRFKKSYKTTTIYVHRLVAERFLNHEKKTMKNVAGVKDGNKLNCQISNLCYRTRKAAMRQRKTSSKLGYTGVFLDVDGNYRAMISIDRRMTHIGLFPTVEEAAMAYNKKSRELYGEDGKINIIKV